MGPLALIVALELVLSTSILGLSSHPQLLSRTKHQFSHVLGIQEIAQVDSSTDNSTPTDNSSAPADGSPTDTPPQTNDNAIPPAPDSTHPNPEPSPVNSSQEPSSTIAPEQSSSLPTTTQDSTVPTNTQPLFEQEINPSSTGQNQPSATNTQPSEEVTSNNQAESSTQTQAVLNADDLITSPENINSQSILEAKKEDESLSQISDPKEQTLTLITFATDKVKDMSNFTKSDDFSSTNFAASRFNEQIDKAITNLEKLPKKDQAKIKQQLTNFCSQADQVLRTVELAVPQESEQDIQIARGQCQELQL